MYMENSLSLLTFGSFWTDSRFSLALPSENDAKKILFLLFQKGACPMNVAINYGNIGTTTNRVHIDSIELTGCNQQQAEEILHEIADFTDCENKDDYVAMALSTFENQRYRKRIRLDLNAEIPDISAEKPVISQEEIDSCGILHFLYNSEYASRINEVTLSFQMSESLAKSLEKYHIENLILRNSGAILYSEPDTATIARLQLNAQRSDVILIDDSSYENLKEKQLELIKPYFAALPVIAVKHESEKISDFEEITDIDELREEYFAAAPKMTSISVTRLLEALKIAPVFTGRSGKALAVGMTSGENYDNMCLYNTLASFAVEIIAEKIIAFCDTAIENAAERLASAIGEFTADDSIKDFLKSDKPLIHSNGGITIKSHGKYKFAESCELAAKAYEMLDNAIEKADFSDCQKAFLRGKLLRFADSYALYNDRKIICREDYVFAAEKARSNREGDIITAFVKNIVDSFIRFSDIS